MNSRTGAAAAIYADRFGFRVFPCRPKGKEPLTPHGCKDASHNSEQIAEWWMRWPDANVGIACGEPSGGLLVLDVDGEEGQESLRSLEGKHGFLPKGPQVITGKGEQYYFRAPSSFKNRVGLVPGLDIRSDGAYCIAPPSLHPNGRTYHWEVSGRIDEVPIPVPPSWLIDMLSDSTTGISRPSDWREIIGGVSEGSRNQSIAQLAGHLLRRYVDPRLSLELIQAWNAQYCSPPLSEAEVQRTVESIASLEIRRRGGVA